MAEDKERWLRQLQDAERELEEKERAWQASEKLLCNTVNKLAGLLEDQAPAWKKDLRALRKVVKGSPKLDQLESVVKQFSDAIVHQEPTALPSVSAPGSELLDLLRALSIPNAYRGRVNQLLVRLEGVEEEKDLLGLIREASALLGELIQGGASGETDSSQVCALLISEVLFQLLERLSLPMELSERLESLKQNLEQGVEVGQWNGMLIEVSDMALEIRAKLNQDRKDTEHFLKRVTERLHELDAFFEGAEAHQRAAAEEGRAFDEAFAADIRGIERRVDEAQEISLLKSEIQVQLEALETRVSHFRQQQIGRQEEAEGRINALSGRLAEMERETAALRERVRKERRAALIDTLTRIPNRLALEERLAQETARLKRFKEPLSLVVFDVDLFKRINDDYGHLAGDNALKSIAKLLASRIRETDFIARYGGEEFVLVMPGADLKAAAQVADKLRSAVERSGFHFRGTPVQITVSGGVAQFKSGEEPAQVFERADKALYKAKQGGRNRIVQA